jgi:hypothetical protein
MATTGDSKMTKQSTKATTAPTTENILGKAIYENGKIELYDALTLHREQLEQMQTLISLIKKELADTKEYEFYTAKNLLDIAGSLTDGFINHTQYDIDKIESLAPTATGTKQ